MKKSSVLFFVFSVALGCFWFLFTTACSSQNRGESHAASSGSRSAYSVPEDKADEWSRLQNMVQKEYQVCLEHCGNDSSCMKRCRKNYESRLKREHERMMSGQK